MSAPKLCTCCGRAYDAEGWAALPCIGFTDFEDEEGRLRLEMRNCSCGSTLAIEEKSP